MNQKNRPNIIFILADDLGWCDLSCYGSTFYETPNLDALSRAGMLFTDAYAASPVCSPTRASILTGKYPTRVGVTSHIDHTCERHPLRGKLCEASYFRELPLTETSIARRLRCEGYATWHVGKWHLGKRPCYPERHGFDVNVGGSEFGSPGKGGFFSPWTLPGLDELDVPEGTYLTDYLSDRAIDLIRKHSSSDKPFFLNMWYYAVHTPIQAKPEKVEKYRAKARSLGLDTVDPFVTAGHMPAENLCHHRIIRRIVQSDPVYAAMVESLDENVGRLLGALEEVGVADNSIVFFTSDNGGLSTSEGSPTCNAPLAEGKGWRYEGGVREPMIVRWPGVVLPASKTNEPITSPDFYPTILDVCGLDLDNTQHQDGQSFLPLLKGEDWKRSEPLFWHFPHYANQGDTPGAAIRDGRWKLITFLEDNHFELYDLKKDLGENRDIHDQAPEKADELYFRLKEWEQNIGARQPTVNLDFSEWESRARPGRHSAC